LLRHTQEPDGQQNLRIALALPLFVVLSAFVNDQITHFTPRLYDAALLRADFGVSAAIRR
jgi:hypothetical protein